MYHSVLKNLLYNTKVKAFPDVLCIVVLSVIFTVHCINCEQARINSPRHHPVPLLLKLYNLKQNSFFFAFSLFRHILIGFKDTA